jgi:hypothetical protein
MELITELTPEQTAQFDKYAQKWIDIGMSTEPLDFESAKAAVIKAYEIAGLKPPTRFEVADSPNSAIDLIQKIDPSQTRSDILNGMSYGCHDAAWLSFYDYFLEVCGVEECRKLEGLFELAKSCGWLSMYDELVVFQHRPTSILLDDEKRLHCEFAPAITYRDGYSVYAWHGVRIPGQWIEDKSSITPEIALHWENVEQRRAACEIIGWKNILDMLNAQVIDQDEDPMIGTLVEVDIPDIGREKFLRVLCGTGREFALPVPPEMETALQANAWTFGMDETEFFKPEVRT